MAGKLYITTFGGQLNEYDSAKKADVPAAAEGTGPTPDPTGGDAGACQSSQARAEAAGERTAAWAGELQDRGWRCRGRGGRLE